MAIAGVPLSRELGAMQASLLHTVEEVNPDRKTRNQQALPVNPMRYNPHKTAVEKKTAAYWDTGKTQVASKKTMNLQDGYVRLFAGDSEHVKASMGESKKLGKRIFDDPKPKANDPRPKLGGQW